MMDCSSRWLLAVRILLLLLLDQEAASDVKSRRLFCYSPSLLMNKIPQWFWAEVLGTFLLVFFGCSSVAVAVTLGAYQGVFQVAAVWGLGLALAIYLTAAKSGAHLNPAISLAFVVIRKFPIPKFGGYVVAQFLGAFLAAALVYTTFSGPISAYEQANGIVRGET